MPAAILCFLPTCPYVIRWVLLAPGVEILQSALLTPGKLRPWEKCAHAKLPLGFEVSMHLALNVIEFLSSWFDRSRILGVACDPSRVLRVAV